MGYTSVSSGNYYSCALRTDGSIVCWGDSQPANVPAGPFNQISAGSFHACALRPDGTIACWGSDAQGQLTNIPTGSFKQVSAGFLHTCALRIDGTVACWGQNSFGQSTPPTGTFTQVSAAYDYSCGVRTDGTLTCWGINNAGQTSPPAGTFSQISAAYIHGCGVKTDGSAACWGYNDDGRATPPTGTFAQISAGSIFTCGLKADATVMCWGDNVSGRVTPPSGFFIQISAGLDHTCGLKTDGSIVCWGDTALVPATPPDVPSISITSQPMSTTVTEGQPITLSVTTVGAVTPTYQWRKGGAPLPNATNSSLTIPEVQLGDAGNYDVVVSSPAGSVTSSVATITVADAPLSAHGRHLVKWGGTLFSGCIASFNDAFTGARAGDYTVSVGWGDDSAPGSGAVTAVFNGNFCVVASHTYPRRHRAHGYRITVVITDSGGSTATANGDALVY